MVRNLGIQNYLRRRHGRGVVPDEAVPAERGVRDYAWRRPGIIPETVDIVTVSWFGMLWGVGGCGCQVCRKEIGFVTGGF